MSLPRRLICLAAAVAAAGCAAAPEAGEAIPWSPDWFACKSRFQCIVVYDAFCQNTAVNTRSALVYQDWALQEVELAGERRLCPQPDLVSPIAACHEGRCTYPIPFGRGGERPE